MLVTATFPLHSLNNKVSAESEIRYASDCKSFKSRLNEINSNNGGSYELILTDDIIVKPDDKTPPMNKSEKFMFSATNPDEGEASERKHLTIKSDGRRIYKIQNLKEGLGLLSVDGGAGLTLDLENVILDGGADLEKNAVEAGKVERQTDFLKLQGTYNSKDQSYSLEVNFKDGAAIQNANQNFDSKSKVIHVDASKFNFCGGSIKNCCAFEGGAIYLDGGFLSLMNGEISNCTAKNGGAIFSYGGQIGDLSKENSGLKINSCVASDFGGAIYTTLEDAHFNGLQIKNCKAGVAGGAIYGTQSGLTKIDDITIENCNVNDVDEKLDDGKLLSCGGGAIANGAERQLMIMGGNISSCSTNMNGGAILNCPGGRLALYGGKITNCFISKNNHKISPENLDKNAKKFLGNAICNNCSDGMVIVKPGNDLEIDVSNQAQGNDMLNSICGYKGLFDRTFFETGKISEDPKSANRSLYDESWGILLTGGAPIVTLSRAILDEMKDEEGNIIEEKKEIDSIDKYMYDMNDDNKAAEYYGPTNRGVTFECAVSSMFQLDANEFGISVDGGKNFWYPTRISKTNDANPDANPENTIISGISIVPGSKNGLNNQESYQFHVCGSNDVDGKLEIVVRAGDENKPENDHSIGYSQVFKLWTDIAPPDAPVVTEIDGSKLATEPYDRTAAANFYKFQNMDETKYLKGNILGKGEEGCKLEIYTLDDLTDNHKKIKETAQPIARTDIGNIDFEKQPNPSFEWSASLDKNMIANNLPDSEKVGLIFVQRGPAGNISLRTGVYVGVDMHGPEGQMKFDILKDWFGNFLTDLTFGLFSPEKFDVQVKAYDLGSGVQSVKWLKSNEAFESLEALEAKFPSNSESWTNAQKASEQTVSKVVDNKPQNVEESTWNFQIQKTQNEKFFVYARLTDISGNVTYLRSDGAVFYTPMSAQNLAYVKKSEAGPDSEINLNGNREIFEKTLDNTQLAEENIKSEISNDLFKFSLKAAYLDGLQAGQHDMSFKYYPFNLTPGDISANHCPFPSVDFKLDIKKSTLSDANIKISGYEDQYIYGSKPFKVHVEGLPEGLKARFEIENVEGSNVAQIDGDGNVTLKGVGKFKIKASTDEDENYNAFSTETEVIDVLPCPLKINGLKCSDREYDSTNILKIFRDTGLSLINEENGASLDNLKLSVSGNEWIAKFEDASVGHNKEAKFEEDYFKNHFKLTGANAANFRLEMPTFTATITPKKVKFDPQSVKIKSKDYDTTDKAEFEEPPKFADDFIDKELKINNLPIKFEDDMPGQNKDVFIDREHFEWSLVNDSYSRDNYDFSELFEQPIGTADIYVTAVDIDNFPRYINQNTLEIHGTGIPGYEIQITDSNGNALPIQQNQVIVDEAGNWEATLTDLNKRDNSINVVQKDPDSDIQSEPVSKSVFVDIDLPNGQVQINDAYVATKILSDNDMGDQKIFELFYPYDVGVKILAQDAFSGVDTIKHFVSDQFYSTVDQLSNNPDIVWIDGANVANYQVPEASAVFNINKQGESEKLFIYAQIKDKAGNIIYLRTYGAVLYDEPDVGGNLSYTRCSDKPSTVEIDLHGSEIQSIRLKSNDGLLDQMLELNQWEVEDSENGQLLKLNLGDMDELLKAGDYEIEVIYKPSCLLNEPDENINLENLPSKKVNLIVGDLDLSDQDFFGDLASQDERIYGDEVDLSNDQNITYRVESLGGNAEILHRAETSAPYAKMTKVGKVRIVASYGNVYTGTKEITIRPKPVTINNIYARDKEYDKTTNASYYSKLDGKEIAPFNSAYSYLETQFDDMSEPDKVNHGSKYSYINKKLEVEGLLPEDVDKVYVNGDRALARFENCSAGQNKKVNFSGFELCDVEGYDVSGNYIFIQPTQNASIAKKSIQVVDIQISDKTFNGDVDADFAKDPVVNGIVEGDQVWIEGKPVFEHSGPGEFIPVYRGSVVLAGEDASNYTLVWPDIVATIYPNPANNGNGNAGGGPNGGGGPDGGGGPIIKPTAGENDFDSDFVNKYDDSSRSKGLGEDAIAENVMTCLVVFLTVSLLSTLAIILIRNKNKQR